MSEASDLATGVLWQDRSLAKEGYGRQAMPMLHWLRDYTGELDSDDVVGLWRRVFDDAGIPAGRHRQRITDWYAQEAGLPAGGSLGRNFTGYWQWRFAA